MDLDAFLEICLFRWNLKYHPDRKAVAPSSDSPTAVQYSSFMLIIITCVLGLVGNTIVIIITGLMMKTHKSRIWFLNLAIADLLYLLILPLKADFVLNANWSYGERVCKMYNFLSVASMYASIFILTALTFERFLSVMAPIWHHNFYSPRLFFCTCAAIWAVTVLCSIPAILHSNTSEHEGKAVCSLYEFDFYEPSLFRFLTENVTNEKYYKQLRDILNNNGQKYCEFTFRYTYNKDIEIEKWNSLLTSTHSYLIPLLVIGYFIPLCVILCSITAIVCKVRTFGTIRSSKLYRITTAAIMTFFITHTPLVIAQIIILSCLQNMDYILMSKMIDLYPLLSSIASLTCCLNPIIYVFLGREVISVFRNFHQRIRHRNVTSLRFVPVTSI